MTETGGKQRIDKWLFFARVVKSRSLAAKLAASGRVRVNADKIGYASHGVKPGDVLTIPVERRILVYKIMLIGDRRGPAPEAQLLYEDISPPPGPKNTFKDMILPQRDASSGRPTKRERRAIDRLRME